MRALIGRAQAGLVRRRFATPAELVAGLYAALVQYLETRQLLRFGPFDAAHCSGATLDDLNVEGMYRFISCGAEISTVPPAGGDSPGGPASASEPAEQGTAHERRRDAFRQSSATLPDLF